MGEPSHGASKHDHMTSCRRRTPAKATCADPSKALVPRGQPSCCSWNPTVTTEHAGANQLEGGPPAEGDPLISGVLGQAPHTSQPRSAGPAKHGPRAAQGSSGQHADLQGCPTASAAAALSARDLGSSGKSTRFCIVRDRSGVPVQNVPEWSSVLSKDQREG